MVVDSIFICGDYKNNWYEFTMTQAASNEALRNTSCALVMPVDKVYLW